MYGRVYVFKILTIHGNHHSRLVLPKAVVLAPCEMYVVRDLI